MASSSRTSLTAAGRLDALASHKAAAAAGSVEDAASPLFDEHDFDVDLAAAAQQAAATHVTTPKHSTDKVSTRTHVAGMMGQQQHVQDSSWYDNDWQN